MRLIISAGERHIDGFTTHDVQDLPGIDICCDFFDLPNYVDKGSCEEVHFTHALEHFPMAKTQEVLGLVNGLMKKGGKLYIEVPNFYWHALGILSNPSNRQMVEYAFGGQLNEWDFHYNGFTPEILHEDLDVAGFKVTELLPNSSIECWSVKK
jgi:hypothetical protein